MNCSTGNSLVVLCGYVGFIPDFLFTQKCMRIEMSNQPTTHTRRSINFPARRRHSVSIERNEIHLEKWLEYKMEHKEEHEDKERQAQDGRMEERLLGSKRMCLS